MNCGTFVCSAAMAALAAFACRAAEVRPSSLYEAKLRARVVKGVTLEDCPQLEDLVSFTASHYNKTKVRFTGFNWQFRDAKGGKVVPRPHRSDAATALYHRDWRDVTLRFWTPENATWLDVSAGRGVEVAGLSLRRVAPSGSLNVNPRFDMAEEYVPGWQLLDGAVLGRDRNGTRYVNTEEGRVASDLFPVEPGSCVKVALRGILPRFVLGWMRLSASICFFDKFADAGGKEPYSGRAATKVNIGKDCAGAHVYTVPPGKHWARILVSGGIVYECSATKVDK